MSIEQGSQLGPYEIVGLIGRGGMGVVYRAHDARLARDVAIKVLPDELADDPGRLRRFEREARAASSMSHPNILTVHDVGRHDGSPYLVTELLEGETLAERLSRGRLRTPLALEIATRIAEGLATAHSRGIVHRDLKPANVFLAADGGVKILDFGLAKLLPAAEGDSSKLSRTTLTESFALMGTPAYMAPEQVAGGGADFRADQFALGCILYEMLSGERPFARENLALTLAAIAEAEPPDLSERLPGLPPPVRWVVRRCLEKEPARRYRDSGDLALDLTLLADRADELARWAETPAPRGGRARWPWVAAAGLLAVLAVAVWPRSAPTTPPTVPEVRLLTYSGRDGSPVVSPSGATVAFSSERDGRRRIWLKELRSGAEVPLTEGPSDDLPRYSPSGSEILFVRQTGDGSDLYRVPAVGGQPRRILADAHGGDWLPDGRRIVFVRTTVEDGVTRTALGSVGAEGSEAEILLSFDGPLLHHPRVSPDGSRVALT
ncbi:MAG: protein kinase, partial [Thermoanaerobaculia bacterium]|nr:protein kinase [Thermoanaerobaculia bacterium]